MGLGEAATDLHGTYSYPPRPIGMAPAVVTWDCVASWVDGSKIQVSDRGARVFGGALTRNGEVVRGDSAQTQAGSSPFPMEKK